MITDWFTNKIGPFWNEVNTWMFNLNENVDKTELKIFWEVMNFGLNHYPTDEIRDGKHMLEDLENLDRYEKNTPEYQEIYERVINVGEYKNINLN